MVVKSLTADDLVKQLAFERYVSEDYRSDVVAKCKDVFVAQIEKTSDATEHVEKVLEFMRTIWRKYDCQQVANVYAKFIKMEEALFGLERDEETGKRYRDHFVHMFNCFVFGLRVISSLLAQCPGNSAKKLFKIENESLKEVGLPFGADYRYDQRLFYLWTLISTFHDIAIPFQHLVGLGKGISEFVDEFGWAFTDPHVAMPDFDSSQLYYYFGLVGSVYGGGLKLVDRGRKYKRSQENQHYLTKLLGREFDQHNHGVLSGFFMWKIIEEIFLVDRSPKYKLKIAEFNRYTEYVLEQDITRAALAISLHAINKDRRTKGSPKVFPISFGSFPLTFLLILSDELQEYLRWEGTSFRRQLMFSCHPRLNIKYHAPDNSLHMTVAFSLQSENEKAIVAQAKRLAKSTGTQLAGETISAAADLIAGLVAKTLEEKLLLGENVKLKLKIYEDWNKERYSKDLCSPAERS